jgi:cellulose synthase (UDP-forming)
MTEGRPRASAAVEAESPPPTVPASDLPLPDGPLRRLVTSTVVVAALLASSAYLIWRVTDTVNWSAWWVSVPFVLIEFQVGLSLALFAFVTWDTTSRPPEAPLAQHRTVAVLIPTYNEPLEVLLPTFAAAVALEPDHQTWVLDDGERPEVEMLARQLGAEYLARPTHEHAKAGNLNHALEVIDVDLIAVLDADHVAMPGLLLRTLGYFADPQVAVVQTPQADFYNVESFEHTQHRAWLKRRQERQLLNEEELFDRVIQAGNDRWGGVFWCGTNAVLRVAALREIGGVAVETVTEDIHTTIRLHRRGWKSLFHNEVLASGLAAADVNQYAMQRVRWGAGAMEVLRIENPLFVSGLTFPQRLTYASTLLGWFDSWRLLGTLLIPPLVLLTGDTPIRAPAGTFLLFFGGTFLLQRLAQQRLSRGRAPALLFTMFALVRMQACLQATLRLIIPNNAGFRVTPKGRVGHDHRRGQVPVLLTLIIGLNLVAAVWFAASLAGITPLRYGTGWVAYSAAFWLLVNSGFVAAAATRTRNRKFGSERRAAVRFDVQLAGHLDHEAVSVTDISWTGACVVAREGTFPAELTVAELSMQLSDSRHKFAAIVRSRHMLPDTNTEAIALEFIDGQHDARAQLALALVRARPLRISLDLPRYAPRSLTTPQRVPAVGPTRSLPHPNHDVAMQPD